MTYGIKHKEYGEWFAGFDTNGDLSWSPDPNQAVVFDNIDHAEAQASLFRKFLSEDAHKTELKH